MKFRWNGRTTTRLSIALTSILLVTPASYSAEPLEGYEEVTPAAIQELPEPVAAGEYPAEIVAHGRYLVGLLQCGSCHTDGALVGKPNPERLLAGSAVGIAFTNPMTNKLPGVVYPPNLTPDKETGLGNWNEQQIIKMIRTGTKRHGSRAISVMPSVAFARIKYADVQAIAAYLRSLPPVRHEVPQSVAEGQKATAPFVHFGIYRSTD